ncbi:ABC transporter permease [Sanguibacter sp. HDW7]|uniref:ABC transporter permease n=1 Tax=Sanguibacter sp. HDW7 TaxID=2714931 RepID=UPI001F112C19|nr:FtsX-like permease family protein [Sanguibacter sp. HDW7]
MRRSIGRLVAAGVAIAIGTAFVAATLLAGNIMTSTSTDAIASSVGDADLVIDTSAAGNLTLDAVRSLSSVDGVAAATPRRDVYVSVSADGRTIGTVAVPVASDPRLEVQSLTAGALPTSDAEVALPAKLAERLGVTVGGTVGIVTHEFDEKTGEGKEVTVDLTLVGLTDDPDGAYLSDGGALLTTAENVTRWHGADGFSTALLLLDDGADVTQVRQAVAAAVADALRAEGMADDVASTATIQTKQEYAQARIAELSGQTNTVVYVVLAFGALALIVAGLVIANTFQVLVAQRTRTLALLRCVGATKKQLRGSVLLEAAVLGTLASLTGIVVGAAGVQGLLAVLRTRDLGVPLPTTIDVTPAVVLVPLVAGLLVTVISAFAPARVATRVAPLAALRPADAPSVRQGSKVRLVLAIILTVLGGLLLAGGVAAGTTLEEPLAGLLLGIPGGALSFVGLAVGSVFWIPAVTAGVGRLLSRTGASARLASANTLRNPRRTAATSTALLIGVTLVAMMSTGAATARATFNQQLDEFFYVDALVDSGTYGTAGEAAPTTPLTPKVVTDIAAIDGVTEVAEVHRASVMQIEVLTPGGPVVVGSSTLMGVDPERARSVLNDPGLVDGLTDGTLVVQSSRDVYAGATGARVTLADGTTTDLDVVVREGNLGDTIVTLPTLEDIAGATNVSDLLVRIDPADPIATVNAIQDSVDTLGVWVAGAVAERAMFDQVINVLLAVVVGLLAVAVVIALIGVTNTLSLSVIERQRENAMLRAIGLSKRQLRTTLAIEGLLIAVVGTALGVVLGLVYGWSGAAAVLGSFGSVAYTVPWRDIALVLLVAVVAGLLASVLPARRAVRTSPVEALAVD